MEIEKAEYKPHKVPNILVTGTPGTGKTTLCQLLNESLNFNYLNLGKIIKDNKLYEEWDDQLDVPIFDQDMLMQYLQENYNVQEGGLLVDFHSPSILPSYWFDLVIIMSCSNDVLYKRLQQRKYTPQKINQNIQCQIFQQVKLDVQELYQDRKEAILCLNNQKQEDMQKNIQIVINWLTNFKNNYSDKVKQ